MDQLARLAALSPDGSMARVNALVRRTCGRTLSLPSLPAGVEAGEPLSDAEQVVVEFAEQFSIDVSKVSADQRERLTSALGSKAIGAVVLMYIADFVPRVLAGLDALGLSDHLHTSKAEWDHVTDPADAVFNEFLPAVARQSTLDPLTSEIVRLRVAA